MKLKKISLIMVITIAIIMIASIFSVSYAATEKELTIKEKRFSATSEGYSYKVSEKIIHKIHNVNSNDDNTYYCMRGGPGFGSTSSMGTGSISEKTYINVGDMKNPSTIGEEYAKHIPTPGSAKYNSLLWLLDNLYVAPKETSPTDAEIEAAYEYRDILLNKAGVEETIKELIYPGYDETTNLDNNGKTVFDKITEQSRELDSWIDAIQQLAVWHFTNDTVENDPYYLDVDDTFEMFQNNQALSDVYNGEEVDAFNYGLFNYLVETAEENNDYIPATASQPYEFDEDTTQTVETENNQYIIGPFKINKISDTEATLNITFKNGNTTINPTIQDASKNVITSLQDEIKALEKGKGIEFFIILPDTTNIEEIIVQINGSYFDTTITYWSVSENNNDLNTEQPIVEIKRAKNPYSDSAEFTPEEEPEEIFDLALRKFITQINEDAPSVSRVPKITEETLNDLSIRDIDTAVKTHTKNALVVKTGDTVIYTIRIYNEGEVDGYVEEITDYLPEGLEYLPDNELNKTYRWKMYKADGTETTNVAEAEILKTDYLSKAQEDETERTNLLKAFDGDNLQYLDVQVACKVVATVQNSDTILKNIAEITEHSDSAGDTTIKDIDSIPNNLTNSQKTNYNPTTSEQGWGYEDDDDFEDLVIIGKYFDLSLRKFITAIGDNELIDENGKYIREPVVDVSTLLNGGKTATYNHNKTPINVDVGDIVTYTIRVYNEGQVDGYVDEITDHLPEWLEFINDEFNASYGWKVSTDERTVTTDITSLTTIYSASRDTIYADRTSDDDKVLLKAFDETSTELDYIDVKIKCRVKDSGISEKITNIAEITKSSDTTGSNLKDRDNDSLVTLPTDETLPNYKDDEIERGDEYIPGQEDDDDFEKVIVQKFDLALRKYITGVNNQTITNRVPVFSMDSNGKMTYTHTKTPVEVANGDIVIYTLRIFNEGNQAGYATEVKDDLPEGLEYLPDNELNKEYRWKMYKADGTETTDIAEAKTIKTDYLSKEQEDATGRENLIDAFNKNTMTMPDYKDVKIAFKVTEPNTSDRILINIAEISNDSDDKGDPVEDIDSTPDNDKDGEDDIDIEKVKVKYFDLALEKIITEYSISKDGKTSTTKTGHKFGVQPEPIVKVELVERSIKIAVVKFKYQIKVTNQGEIAGYAEEIKDYIPEGLEFVQEDNPKWKASEDGKTVTTDQLKDILLEPGESAVVEITLKWINGDKNLGLKQNWAEISDDRNDSDSPDIDSTPDNRKDGEDDIDDASVILSVVTGIGANYILIIGGILLILATGVILIKKFVI